MKLSRIVSALPATVPFVAPDELQRNQGFPFHLRLGANESAFGVSPLAIEAMVQAAETAAWYGDPTNHELTEAVAAHHGVRPQNILIAGGIDELLGLVVRALLDPGDIAVASHGAYPTFGYHVAGFGAALETVPYKEFTNDCDSLAQRARATRARALYLANPDNPTGSLTPPATLSRLVQELPTSCIPLLDEAYADFVTPENYLPVRENVETMVRFRTFSKAHGMAGLRIGYLIGPSALVAAIQRVRLHFGVNRVAQAGALASLHDAGFLRQVIAAVNTGKEDYYALASRLGIRTIPSSTNFVLFCFESEKRAEQIVERLTAQRVFVRTARGAGTRTGVRATVGNPQERAEFAEILAKC